MANLFRCACLVLVVLAVPPRCDAGPARVNVRLRAVTTAESLSGTVTMQCGDGESVALSRKGPGAYVYVGDVSEGAGAVCEFALQGPQGAPYLARTARLFATALLRRSPAALQLFIASPLPELTFVYVHGGDRYADDPEPDRAMAYFLPAYEALAPDNSDEMRFRATYGYARALQRACISRGYDSCGAARQLYGRLLDLFAEHGWTTQYGVSKASLIKESDDTSAKERIVLYSEIPRLAEKGQFQQAGDLALRGLADLDEDPEGFRDVGLTRERLLTDAGDAYLKAGISSNAKGDTAAARVSFTKANEQFSSMTKPDAATAANWALTKTKLDELR